MTKGIAASWLAKAREVDWARALPVWLFASWATSLVVRAHWPYILEPVEHSVDEGYLIAIGQRMLHGRMLPYVEGAAHTGPVALYSGALIAAFGQFSWLPTRVAAALGFALLSWLAFAGARRAGWPLAGALAAAGTPFYVTLRMPSCDGIAYNAELPAVVFTLAALYAGARAAADARQPVSRGWLIAAGVLAGLAGLSKQIAAAIVLPVIAYTLVQVFAREELPRRERIRHALAFLAGGAAVVVLVFGRLAVGGALSDAYYYLVTYNRFPYMAQFAEQPLYEHYRLWMVARPFETALAFGAVAWGFAQLLAAYGVERSSASSARIGALWWRALQRSSFDWMAAAMALGGLIAARAARREFEHYYVMVVPGYSLLLGILIERALVRASALSAAVVFLPLLLIGEVTLTVRKENLMAWWPQETRMAWLFEARRDPPLCEYIRQHSKPSDTLFVWGFRPQLHVSCARLPASRFVYSSFVSGWVPTADGNTREQDDASAVPGSRELLVRELEASKPPVIVDSARTIGMRRMQNAGPVWDYISTHYHSDGVVAGDEVYLRN